MRCLITGSTGLVGQNLARTICADNKYEEVYLHYHSKMPKVLRRAKYFSGDLRNKVHCDLITKDIDIIFHCAAASFGAVIMGTDPLALVTPNVIMNTNLMDSAYKNGVKQFVFLASTTGYPDAPGEKITEDRMFDGNPHDKYFGVGWAKRYTEKLCELYATKLNPKMNCVVLRPSNIYGPHDKYDFDKCHVLPALIRRFAEKHNPLDLWGDGTETRDFIYVDDMVKAITLAADLTSFEQLNIGSGTQYSINDTIEVLKYVTGHNPTINKKTDRPTMIASREISVEKAEKVLGFTTSVSLKEGLQKTLQWYNSCYE